MAVYLLHSTIPLVTPDGREVRHYLGYCQEGTFHRRMGDHRRNHSSAKLVQALLSLGGELCLGNYYPGATPLDERRMKKNGHIGARCLVCQRNELQRQIRLVRMHAEATSAPVNGPS